MSRKTRVTDCRFERNEMGIYITNCDETVLKDNVFVDNERNVKEYEDPWLTPWRICYLSILLIVITFLCVTGYAYDIRKKERVSPVTTGSSIGHLHQKSENESNKR